MGQLAADKDHNDENEDGGKEGKEALARILELTPALTQLPAKSTDIDGCGGWGGQEAQQLEAVVDSVDTIKGLFHHISSLANDVYGTQKKSQSTISSDPSPDLAADSSSEFDTRVSAYLQNVQALNAITKKEKHNYEQRLVAVRNASKSQRKVSPPPLPLPTQNCMILGWDMAIQLMKATRKEGNGDTYLHALQTIQEHMSTLKPLAYLDGMYVSPSASQSFNLLCDFLIQAAVVIPGRDVTVEEEIARQSISVLCDLALARGSLSYLLSCVLWMLSSRTETPLHLNALLTKVAAIKEQSLYGICEASGELYCCGQNSYGELGVGDDIERHQLTFVPFGGWDDVKQVVSGNEILAMLTNSGVVLTAGLNKSGQCGHGHFDERVMLLRPVEALRSQKITYIAASNGCEHMIAVTDTGLAYSWGYNDRGQLGHENITTKIHQPKLIESIRDKKIVFAAVSYHHSAIVTDKGDLYTFGMNDCGQLGQDTTTHVSEPQHVKALEGYIVTMVSCGLYHTVACTSTGELFTFGKNDYGQLGVGHNRQSKTPCLVATPNDHICFVTCGYYHSVAVATSGRSFSFGRNDYGQLGIGTKVHQSVPHLITVGPRITRAACGCYHTVLLSEQGLVYTFGRNNKGQLGNRGNTDSLLPVPLHVRPEKSARRVLDIAAGFYTTSLIVERKKDGDVATADQSLVLPLCGRVDIDRSGEIEGLSNFGSISAVGVSLYRGKWFYEVEVVTSGLIQIGWIDGYFQGSSDQGEGVGDHAHSWSYDGNRQRRWNSGSSAYGDKWKAGDVIGCLLNLDDLEMRFFRNGVDLGIAYADLALNASDARAGLMPGISLERGEVIRLNLGHRPFAFPVNGIDGIARAIVSPSSQVVLQTVALATTATAPEALEGSARILMGDKLFVIGGMLSGPTGSTGVSTNKVWVYSQSDKAWGRWSDLPIGLRYHQVVAIDDHTLLVIGGEHDGPVSRHLDLYRVSTIANADGSFPPWELVQSNAATSALPPPRAHHAAAAIRIRLETLVLLYGGKSNDDALLGDTWFLSLEDYSWAKLPSSVALDPGPRFGCSLCVVGESVYIFGGLDKEDRYRADLWRYNTFDRVWHLCHDDYIYTPRASSTDKEFNPPMPAPRTYYSMASDLGHVWIYGGENRKGDVLGDLWGFSLTKTTWTQVEVTTDDGVSGVGRAALFIEAGSVCAFDPLQPSTCLLYGGRASRIAAGGATTMTKWETTIRYLSPTSSSKLPSSGMTSLTASSSTASLGKASTVLAHLRSKHAPLLCPPTAGDTAICLLSHLDRLIGGDIALVEADSIQPSRCSYRSLCIDAKESSFAVLLQLLSRLSTSVLAPNVDSTTDLYPLVVVLRLGKFNFFELSTSCMDVGDMGFAASSTERGGTLFQLRELLFQLADVPWTPTASAEVDWFGHVIQRETVATINAGFSVMFPSLLDRLAILTRLLHDDKKVSNLLVPMLVPNFASPKALFALMSEESTLVAEGDRCHNVVTMFADKLLQSLWLKSTSLGTLSANVDTTMEFQCLNVLLRATVFWSSMNQGWTIAKHICIRLVHYMQLLLETAAAAPLSPVAVAALLSTSFPGKLLPFLLLNMTSLPSIQQNFSSAMADLWPNLEMLLHNIHMFMATSDGSAKPFEGSSSGLPGGTTVSTPLLSLDNDTLLQHPVVLSARMQGLLQIPPTTAPRASMPGVEFATRFWEVIRTTSSGFHRINVISRDYDLYRVVLAPSAAAVLQQRSLVVGFRGGTDDHLAKTPYDSAKVSLTFSWDVLTTHIQAGALSSKSPFSTMTSSSPTTSAPATLGGDGDGACIEWLHDFQNLLSYLGSHYASSLILATESTAVPSAGLERWLQSPLFRGGLEEEQQSSPTTDSDDHPKATRNAHILQQILDNEGAGAKLVEKVKTALDPDAASAHANPKLRAASTRMKRIDSVERTLEKSGGFEAVDRAVRSTFAVLLKHTHVAYTSNPVTRDGMPGEALLDAWRAALQLRRWIVREQQKLAVSSSDGKVNDDEDNELAKERQQSLYKQVCDPIVARARLLLQLAAVPVLTTQEDASHSPFKILPGISNTPFDFAKLSSLTVARVAPEDGADHQGWLQQLNRLMETKSMDTIEEEDERIQTDIFAFLQQTSDSSVETPMKALLEDHQRRAGRRLQGLEIFFTLLSSTASIPAARFHILPVLAKSFRASRGVAGSDKVHYSHQLELAGRSKIQAIGRQFFALVSHLLDHSSSHLLSLKQKYCSGSTDKSNKPSVQTMHQHVHAMLLALDVCSIPYTADDWVHLSATRLPSFLTETTSWASWKQVFTIEDVDEATTISESASHQKPPILPAGVGWSGLTFLHGQSLVVEPETHIVTSVARPVQAGDSAVDPIVADDSAGGLVVAARPLAKGRWYWEIVWRHQGAFPIFVGVSNGCANVNHAFGSTPSDDSNGTVGVFLCKDKLTYPSYPTPSSYHVWARLQPIGVLLDCDSKTLDIFCGVKRVQSLNLAHVTTAAYFPAVGVVDGEIQWDMYAPVPARIWATPPKFTFVSGGLVADSFGGNALSWSGRVKGPNVHLAADCSTLVAGDCLLATPQIETVVTNKWFLDGQLYVELSVLASRHCAHFVLGVVDSTFVAADQTIDGLHLEYDDIEQDHDGLLGVLFDFSEGKLTVYQKRKEAIVHSVDLSGLTPPYVPALSVLCNGAILFTNFHPHARPQLPPSSIYPLAKSSVASSSATEKQVGKVLEFQVLTCDGGEFSASHAVTNLLVDDSTVYSSAGSQNISLVLKHTSDTPFCITYAMVRGPGAGYTAPLQHALVFVMSAPPELDELEQYNGLTPEEFAGLPTAPTDAHVKRDESIPVMYFVLDGNCSSVSKRLTSPVAGRYVVVKLLRPTSGGNIDVGYLGFCGAFDKENGPAYSDLYWDDYLCTECHLCPIPGICYVSDEDDQVKMCSSCYDDQRGSLTTSFYACVPSDGEDRGDASTSVLCAPRKAWIEYVQALYESTKPSTSSLGDRGGSASPAKASMPDDLFDDVELFACGQNNYGELCLGHCNSTSKLEHVPLFTAKSVKQMTGGNEVLAVVMRDGGVYTCGLNKSGQCGNGTFEERVVLATPVRALSGVPIVMVAAANGCEHMIAVAQDGSAYSWGYNDRGQLGLGSTISKSHTPKLIESLHEKYVVVSAGVSYHHSAVVTSNGELLTFGMNDCGQLGLDHTQHQHTPQIVDALASQVVTNVSCGLYHTAVVTAGGDVYTCGKNDYGQLGLGHSRSVKVPTHMKLTDADDKAIMGWSGYYHTAVVTDKGKLITFGRNDYGQLGIGSKEHRNTPQTVPLPAGSKVMSAACGCYHSLILLANGRVMVFGRNNKGQLGAGARTLPSADLPLPIPSGTLANDDVVAIAAGFYSSYILTGRKSDSTSKKTGTSARDELKDIHAPDHQSVSSDALFESLMREMDRNALSDTLNDTSPLSLKRSNTSKKLPLLKLLSGTWAVARTLMYQSLQTKKPTELLKSFILSMLDNLAESSKHADATSHDLPTGDDEFFNLSDACVGLIKYCASDKSKADGLSVLSQLFGNQVLWVLLACGSVHADVCSVIASSPVVLHQLIRGMLSSTLSSSIICMRLGMLIFPLQSVSAVNKVYKSIAPHPSDIMTFLFLAVGYPLMLRPPLCKHELGIECATTSLCKYFNCTKGVAVDAPISAALSAMVDKHHIHHAKSCEAVSLVRYLTLFPTWNKAAGATITRALEKTDVVDDLLATICKFYEHFSTGDSLPGDDFVHDDDVVVRQPENTSPELDDPSSPSAAALDGSTDKEKNIDVISESLSFDKKAAALRKKAKDALDHATLLLASIGILGGHTELLREGGHVLFEDFEMCGRFKGGVLVGLKRNARGGIDGHISVADDAAPCTSTTSKADHVDTLVVPLKNLHAVERIPAIPQMFDDNLSDALQALSKLIVPASSFASKPQSFDPVVHSIVGVVLKSFKNQIRWRSTKALASVLKQLPSLDTSTSNNLDVSIVSNIASLLASESSSSTTPRQQTSTDDDKLPFLHAKWCALKEHQAYLAAENVIDSALDASESHVRDEVVQRLGNENALSWGIDAIQSPKKRQSSVVAKANVKQHQPSSLEYSSSAVPTGVWGMLCPVQVADTERDHSFNSNFHLRSPVVRVGRATDSCDIVINDRSVSGRHFHLRRVRQDTVGTDEYFELQDFSKNGTIVNGVRVHGASIRVAHSARISLILSRGGMITYEFHVIPQHPSSSVLASEPLSLLPSAAAMSAGNEPQQQTQQSELHEPRSPAEVQNRALSSVASSSLMMGNIRARLGPQGLRLITTIGEGDVPRALISPNPAVDSPRVGGNHPTNPPPIAISIHSPRTPAVGSPLAYPSSGVLSPASFQQRESHAPLASSSLAPNAMPHGEMAVSEALRIALGRESLNRDRLDPDLLTRTRVMSGTGEVSFAKKAPSTTLSSKPDEKSGSPFSDLAKDLCTRVRDLGGHGVELEMCEKALQLHQGDVVRALKYVQETIGKAQHHLAARSLSHILGRSVSVCSHALKQSRDNIGVALRALLFSPPTPSSLSDVVGTTRGDDDQDHQDDLVSQQFDKFVSQAVDQLSTSADMNDAENPSYSLLDTSVSASPRRASRPIVSPVRSAKDAKGKKPDGSDAAVVPWSVCNAHVEDRIKGLNWRDVDAEEDSVSQLLSAVHARKLLLQVIRLLQPPVDGDAETVAAPSTSNGRIQQILARISQDVLSASASRTLEHNMRTFQNISTLVSSIDENDGRPPQSSSDAQHNTAQAVVRALLSSTDDNDHEFKTAICEDLVMDTMMHVISKTFSSKGMLDFDAKKESEYPKGPFLLSSGLEVAVVATFERVWGVPYPDPLLNYRHKWRKKTSTGLDGGPSASTARATYDCSVTLWKPVLPASFQTTLVAPDKWFALSVVAKTGNDTPTSPLVLVRDNQDGCLARPLRFDCVDVSGKGLPKNSDLDLEFERKQLRTVWWPVAPPGYVALGCVAGTKDAPFDAPSVDSYRCVRADLVQALDGPASCIWQAPTVSLWTAASDYSQHLIPTTGASTDETVVHVLQMSEDDRVLCAPITIAVVLRFVKVLLHVQTYMGKQILAPELTSALFVLVKQALGDKRSHPVSVELVRALTTVIRAGCPWKDKEGVLYCRSKVMFLYQDQEGSLMLSSLLQALVELLLVVDSHHRDHTLATFATLPAYDVSSTLPYRFAVPQHPHVHAVHSLAKVAVTKASSDYKFAVGFNDKPASVAADAIGGGTTVTDPTFASVRFEDVAPVQVFMETQTVAMLVYFEVHVEDIKVGSSGTKPLGFSLGFSIRDFNVEDGVCVGHASKTYSFTPATGKIQCGDPLVDVWPWSDSAHAVGRGDVFGCGLRLDSHEIFFTKNGRWLGTAFSSIIGDMQLHPTVSVDADMSVDVVLSHATEKHLFPLDTTDWDSPMHGFEWFDYLRQVYSIMQSLVGRKPLPDEFLLSADNFLSTISTDVCQSFASVHPYELDLQEATIHIALATSMRIKLDPQCETAGSHCLQIVQGSSSDDAAESEVRTFTGSCGGQEITVDGNEFTWRFPVQSNFQCRIDRVRKGPYIKLENRDTRMSLTRDKGWQTAVGVARFDSGVHTWEVKIAMVTASSNVFLGIARKDVRFDSYLGKDNRGWGWIGNRALWHNGSKQRGTYGEKFKTGDVIRMVLDLKRGTLSYALNGKDLGVAFGPGGTGPKLEGSFYPGFALYNQRDVVELIGGHRLEDSDATSAVANVGGHVDDSAVYASDDEEDAEINAESVPSYRVELATVLSQMGFPMDWCVYALKHCDDDAEQAADFILGNMHAMEALVREEAEAYSRSHVAREDCPAPLSSDDSLDVGSASVVLSSDEMMSTSEADTAVGPLMAAGDATTATTNEKWGVAFTVVPEFSVAGRQLLALRYAPALKELHATLAVFELEHDEAIVTLVNAYCEAKAEASVPCDPLRLRPDEFHPTDDDLTVHTCLGGIPLPTLQARFLILRNFNARLQHVLSLIDYSATESALTRCIRALRGCVFQTVKLNWWFSILKEQQTPAAARPEIEVDRLKAAESTNGVLHSVYAQSFAQLHPLQGSLLRGHDRAFKCQFVGEFGDDFGGLYREILAQMSTELQTPKVLPLLVPCPNEINKVGENRELFVPNIHLRNDPKLVHMAEFLGKLMGIAIRSKTPLDLNLPPVVWKYLVDQPVVRSDIESIHQGCFQVVDTINNITKHGITPNMFDDLIDASFTVLSSDKQEVELVPGGKQVRVTWDDKEEYAQAAEAYRLSEFKPVCQDVARGIATILPLPTLGLLTWKDLATLTCGKYTVDIDLLKRRTTYGDGCSGTDPHIAYFWDVLREFTDAQRSSFLRFVWGRSRLPTHAADFTQDFKISGMPKAVGKADSYLPLAHTCFFSIDMPAYSSKGVMRDKLVYAITHCSSIDADNTTVAQRAGQGLNWTRAATGDT
ncbi:hypothetical protein DYB30_001880 [Aphanomyces astaci]|uniref:B30.2/SPRY domain-containing protein n=3 Tax=Aphanomyces astaci TaxID=112090 RepID=A0A397D4D1_APHAT|nr:hypothetical protein DYB30_001880 [Aphanomyces astaci]